MLYMSIVCAVRVQGYVVGFSIHPMGWEARFWVVDMVIFSNIMSNEQHTEVNLGISRVKVSFSNIGHFVTSQPDDL